MKNLNTEKLVKGPKKAAVAKFTAKSSVSQGYVIGDFHVFTGVTVHTATHDGILYQIATRDSASSF